MSVSMSVSMSVNDPASAHSHSHFNNIQQSTATLVSLYRRALYGSVLADGSENAAGGTAGNAAGAAVGVVAFNGVIGNVSVCTVVGSSRSLR